MLAIPQGPIHWSARGVMAIAYLITFGSLVGYTLFAILTHHGMGPTWSFPAFQVSSWVDLVRATGVGLAAGLIAIPFVGSIRGLKRIFAGLHLPMPLKCALGGLLCHGRGSSLG